jgi:BirA family biotin operon repressor/biotin-[acetyl-CoA-carboxylase] ligase
MIKIFEKIDSTNEEAKRKLYKPWTILLAKEQISGHGKDKKTWFSPKFGGLYFSIILPKSNLNDLQTITILTAFIIAKNIKQEFKLEPLIKLPNDILINNKKICGILTENIIGKDIKLSVIGIGLNTNIEKFPQEIKKSATSLKIELKKEINNEIFLNKIILDIKNKFKSIT